MSSIDISGKWEYSEDGISGTASAGQTTDFDYKIESSNIFISGGELLTQNAAFGDYVRVEIVDKDGVYMTAGTVLQVYVVKRYIDPNTKGTISTAYAGNPPINTYLRVKYTSVGATDVDVAVNYQLHQKI